MKSLLHRHRPGINSLMWRHSRMVLPGTRAGIAPPGPFSESMLVHISVRNTTESTKRVELKVRERGNSTCALLIQEVADASERRRL